MKESNTKQRLKYLMEMRNLKQIDILKLVEPYCKEYNIKFNKSDISQYLSGKSEPNQNKLAILGMALNVNETWLMGYDVPMERMSKELLNQLDNKSININKDYLYKIIENLYNKTTADAFLIYNQLDLNDQGEIRGEMKQMLKSDKYSIKEKLKNA